VHTHVFTIARFTLLEAYRTRLPLLATGVLAFVWAGSLFIHQIAITESDRLQWSFYASGARLASVFMLALYITSSVVREFNEKGLELVLSLDLPRSSYVLGKVSGFIAVCAVLALLAALPMLASVPVGVVVVWCISLFLELAIVCALSMFCIVTFSQVLPAVTVIFGLYLLGRTITAMRLMSETALLGKMGGARPALDFGVDMLAYIIPALDQFAMTEWIAEKTVAPDVLGSIVLQATISIALLVAAALFDFYRREI
jgi:ABC-type transport system involved in multi-copper enzyme maturation permease subunit